VNPRLGDRRQHPRFDVGGKLAATLDVREALPIADLGAHGALLESLAPLAIGAEYAARLQVDGEDFTVRLRVCRVAEVSDARARRFVVGVEFLSVSQPEALYRVTGYSGGAPDYGPERMPD
jgi:PilZ domain